MKKYQSPTLASAALRRYGTAKIDCFFIYVSRPTTLLCPISINRITLPIQSNPNQNTTIMNQSIDHTIARIAEIQKRLLTTASYECYDSTITRPNINLPDGGGVIPSLYVTSNMWIHINVAPQVSDTEMYINAFAGNPHNPTDQKRIADIAQWYHIAQEYMEESVVLHTQLIEDGTVRPINTVNTFTMNHRLTQIREYRRRIDDMILRHTRAECRSVLFHAADTHAETQILARMKRLPEDLVSMIASFIPYEIMFSISIPTPEEIETILMGFPVAVLRKLYNRLVVSRYDQLAGDHVFLFGITYRVISVDLYHHFMYTEWGRRPTTKEQYIHDITSLFRFYCYVHNIYLYKSRVKMFALNEIFQTDTDILRNEITYMIKLIRYADNNLRG